MHMKRIEIEVSDDDYRLLSFLTQEERALALKSGAMCLQECKARLSEATHAEMYREIERQFADRASVLSSTITRLESEIDIERELRSREALLHDEKAEHDINTIVRHKMDVYDKLTSEKAAEASRLAELLRMREKELFELGEKMRVQTDSFDARVNQQVASIGEKMSEVLERSTQLLESVSAKTATKTSSEIGAIGEQCFLDVAKATFCDFDGFDIEDVHNQPHRGDFLLSVRGLTIMVDTKYYKRNVDNPQIDKIKSDLLRNPSIRFAWLVSLYSDIDRRDKASFMFEWVTDTQCVVHVNRLMLVENREAMLKSIFYLCQDYDKQISLRDTGTDELVAIKNSYFKVAERVGEMRKRMRELKAVIVSTRSLYDQLEKDLLNLMNDESNDPNVKHYGTVSGWVAERMAKDSSSVLKSTAIWGMFKKENPKIVQELSVSKFKEILVAVVGDACIVMPKGKQGTFDVTGFAWVDDDVKCASLPPPPPMLSVNTPTI